MRPLALANLAWFIPAGRAKPFDSLEEAIPQLTELPDPLVYDPVGGMEFRLCCLQAVKESYRLNSDSKELENVSPLDGQAPFLQVPPSEFPLNSSKFPCGAKYEDNKDGITSPVEVPYRWCNANCPGWQRSHNSEVNQWIQPFVGYILPAAVFALSVSAAFSFPTLWKTASCECVEMLSQASNRAVGSAQASSPHPR